jgi:Tfp pilus assembly protein PilZ
MERVTHRRFQRRIVEWPASCKTERGPLAGRVLDYSWGGAFFTPDDRDGVRAGERLELAIESSTGGKLLEFAARVVWIGPSQTHECAGFGLEFVPA